jgi:transposase-like protein
MKINEKVLDQLLADCENPEQVLGENGLLKQLTKAVLERALQAEMSHHLGYDKHAPAGRGSGTARRPRSCKATSARSSWKRHATATASSNRGSSRPPFLL